MASTDSPASKKANSDTAKYEIDNVIPLLLATQGNTGFSFKLMAALDDAGRSEFAWQHRFRRWKAAAKGIIAAHPEAFAEGGTTPIKATPKKAPAANGKYGKKQAATTPEAQDEDDSDNMKTKVFCQIASLWVQLTFSQSAKKRASTTDPDDESPTKKAKPASTKKGTAKPKKAPPVKREIQNESEEEENVEMEFEQAVWWPKAKLGMPSFVW